MVKMKTVDGIDFGLEQPWSIELPDSAFVAEHIPEERIPSPLADPAASVRDAVRSPLGLPALGDQVSAGSRVVIAINDWMGVSAVAIPVVLEELAHAGVDERDVKIVVAGGLHQKVTRSELLLSKMGEIANPPYPSPFHILSPEVLDRFWPTNYASSRIRLHDASDEDELVYLGETERGDYVEMNKCVQDCDLLIYMSGWSGLPSIWGGYLGGGQGVTVGLGSARSIMSHHSHRIHEHRDSMASDARHQLFMKHKEDVAAFVDQAVGRKTFYIEAVLNSRGQYIAVFAGDGESIREPIFKMADEEKLYDVPEPADVFVSGSAWWGAPYDGPNNPLMSLVQINARIREYVGDTPPLKEGGVAILCTPCDGTIDTRRRPSDLEMIQLFNALGHEPSRLEDYEEEYGNRRDLLDKYHWSYGAHPLHPFPVLYENAFLLGRASKIIFAGAKDKVGASLVGATAVDTWDEAWKLACRTIGSASPSVMVTPNVSTRTSYLWNVKP
jgi:nickel-dependent lactate racemase